MRVYGQELFVRLPLPATEDKANIVQRRHYYYYYNIMATSKSFVSRGTINH